MLLLVLSFIQIFSGSDNSFLNQSKSQAEYYISEVNKGNNFDENLWALAVLGAENPKIEAFIEEKVRQGDYKNSPLSTFRNIEKSFEQQLKKLVFNTASPDLLISLLVETESFEAKQEIYDQYISRYKHFPENEIDYKSLCQSLIQNQSITSKLLPNREFLLPHFFILLKDKYAKLVSDEYLYGIKKKWNLDASSFNLKISATLPKITYFRVLYLLDEYSDINFLYPFLINNKLFPNSSLKLRIYRFLDYSMYRLGYYNRNLEIARNFTLPLADYLNQEGLKLRIKFATGINLYSIGKMSEAEKIYRKVLTEAKKKDINFGLSSLYNNLALTYYKLGEYNKYLELQFQALQTAKREDSYSHQLEILNNLFIYYSKSKNPDAALSYLKQSQKLAEDKGTPVDIAKTYILLAQFYRKFKKDLAKANTFLSRAENVLQAKNTNIYFIYLLKEQANIYEKQKKFYKALEKYNLITDLTSEQKTPDYIDALVNKALVYLKVGNLFQAELLIHKFKKYDLNQLDFEQVVKAKTVEADYLLKTGHIDKAVSILTPVLEQVVERAKNSADLKTGFWHVEDEYLNAFELAVSIFIKQDRPRKAVELLDRLKTINDASLYQSPLVKASLLNETELTQYKRLTAKLDNSRKKLLAAPEEQRFAIRQTINELKLKKQKLDRKLTTQVDVSPVSVREVQSNLSAYELVLHITELKDKYYIAHISRSDVNIEVVPLDSNLRNLFQKSIQQVVDHNTDLNSLYAIANVLDIQEIPDRIEEITVIPDSYLYQLPIDILPMEKPMHGYSYGEVTYLIEKFETSYLTSLNEFKTIYKQNLNQEYKLNFVGYGVSQFENYTKKSLAPLPFAKTEVVTIADQLTSLSGSKTFINGSSTKAAFKRTAPDSRILHLATHSTVSERDPLFSTFYMSKKGSDPDSAFQSQVFAYELFELKLNNEMIMLNSCESGSGSYLQGTGIMGISRALQYAGANSLILNLWSVNDMLASDFAIYFYGQLNEGKSKAAAMRATKLHFLEDKNASPHFWGPYMLIGNTEPIVRPDQTMNLLVAGTFSFYFLVIAALSFIFQKRRGKG